MSFSALDQGQIIKTVFDAASESLKVTPAAGSVLEVEVSAADGDSILATGSSDGTSSGTLKVMKVSSTGVVSVDTTGGSVTTIGSNSSRTDTFTIAANGVTVNASAYIAKSFSLQVTGTTDVATAWVVVLEGSYDNVTFSTILTHNSGDETDGQTIFTGASFYPCKYFRSRLVSVTLTPATALVVNIIGMN